MLRKLASVPFFLLLTVNVYTQILIAENLGHKMDSSDVLKGKFTLGVSAIRQLETVLIINSGLDISYRRGDHQLITAGKLTYMVSGGENIVNRGFVHTRYRLFPESAYTPETFAQYQWDDRRGMLSRALTGQNIRIRFQSDSLGAVKGGIGLMYEEEVWGYGGVPDENLRDRPGTVKNKFIKTNIYLSAYRKIAKNISANAVVYYQARPDRFIIYPRIAGEVGFNIELTKLIGLSIDFNWIHDSRPVVPIYKFFYTATNSLTLSF